MTEWNKIYSDVHINGGDAFTFITIPNIRWPEDAAKEFIQQFLPEDKRDTVVLDHRRFATIRGYLSRTMSSTFCIGDGFRDGFSVFYIGARRPQDIFKLILKIPGVSRTTSWQWDIKFSVRVAKGDDYDPEKFKYGIQSRGIA